MVNKINYQLKWLVQFKRDGKWYNSDRFSSKPKAIKDINFRKKLNKYKYRVIRMEGR
jgi:hypothetical protein